MCTLYMYLYKRYHWATDYRRPQFFTKCKYHIRPRVHDTLGYCDESVMSLKKLSKLLGGYNIVINHLIYIYADNSKSSAMKFRDPSGPSLVSTLTHTRHENVVFDFNNWSNAANFTYIHFRFICTVSVHVRVLINRCQIVFICGHIYFFGCNTDIR